MSASAELIANFIDSVIYWKFIPREWFMPFAKKLMPADNDPSSALLFVFFLLLLVFMVFVLLAELASRCKSNSNVAKFIQAVKSKMFINCLLRYMFTGYLRLAVFAMSS